jgi:hypothetical protein
MKIHHKSKKEKHVLLLLAQQKCVHDFQQSKNGVLIILTLRQ